MKTKIFSVLFTVCACLAALTIFASAESLQEVDGTIYCLDDDGQVITQAGLYTIDDVVYYVNDQGVVPQGEEGLYTIDGKTYYINDNGIVPVGSDDVRTIDGVKYYFTSDGYILTGEAGLHATVNYTYYVDNQGEIPLNKAGLYTIDGKTYYINDYGVVPGGRDKVRTINGVKYYFNSDGYILTGEAGLHTTINYTYYVNSKGVVPTGSATVRTINNVKYYFTSAGRVLTGSAGLHKASNGYTYYVNSKGVVPTGSAKIRTINGVKYYLNTSGRLVTVAGKYTVNGVAYFVKTDSQIPLNAPGLYTATSGKVYYVNSSGKIKTLAISDNMDVVDVNGDGKLVIVLDPGHDSTHAGATGNSLHEEALNLKIALACKAELEKYYGVTVYLTRSEDGTCPSSKSSTSTQCNEQRVDYAASVDADYYISLHINSSTKSSVRGVSVYYPNSNYNATLNTIGCDLSTVIQSRLVALGLKDLGINIQNSRDRTLYPDGSLADYYGVIRLSKLAGICGIIVEHGYISNSSDVSSFLSTDAKLKKLGVTDATAIAEYLGLKKVTTYN